MPARAYSLANVDRLIHEPSRSLILAVLVEVENADFVFLQHETGLTKGNLSVHLSKLEEAGYLNIEKKYRGKIPVTLCSITVAGREAFEQYREQLREFISSTHPPR